MDWETFLELLLGFQLLGLAVVAGGITAFDPSRAGELYLYEFFGVLLASIITVFGIREMKMLTE